MRSAEQKKQNRVYITISVSYYIAETHKTFITNKVKILQLVYIMLNFCISCLNLCISCKNIKNH